MQKYYQLSPIVDSVSPNLGEAARQANLSPDQMGQVEQIAWTIKQNKKLLAMPQDKARQKFNVLAPEVQESLRVLFPNAAYTKEVDSSAFGFVKNAVIDAVKSPIVGVFKVAGAYNQLINQPYKIFRSVQEGKEFWSMKTWKDAWDGINQFDREAFKEVEDFFGKEKAYVAKGIIEGRTPGEIIEAYGKTSPKLLKAVEEAFNDPENFRQVLDGVKYAQFSPGRDFVRMTDRKPPKNGGLNGDYIDGNTKDYSGRIDFIYQIAIDPLTWFTAGGAKVFTRGTSIARMIEAEGATAGVRKAFQENGALRKLWDGQLGPEIKRYAGAKTAAEKALVRRKIARISPLYDNDEAIAALAAGKVFDSTGAVNYFSNAENTALLLSGRVDGISYQRNGVVLARRFRRQKDAFGSWIDKHVFGATSPGSEFLEKAGDDIWKNLTDAGRIEDYAANPAMQTLGEEARSIKGMQKLGFLASRNPSGEILVGEDAIKTANTFRQTARQVLPRDMAEFVTQKFLASEINDQIVILRNLDTAIMYRYGLGGHPEGLAFIEKFLRQKYGDSAGFGATTRVEVPSHIANDISTAALRKDGDITAIDSTGPIHVAQLNKAFGSLPYEVLNTFSWAARGKKNLLINLFGGATQSHIAREAVDAWSVLTLFPRLGVRSAIDEGFFYAITAPGDDLGRYLLKGRKLSNVFTAYTGSKAGVGPIKALVGKVTGRSVDSRISAEDRKKFIEDIVEKSGGKLTAEDVDLTMIKEMTGQRALEIYGRELNDIEKGYFLSAIINNSDIRTSMARSISSRSSLSGSLDHEILDQLITDSMLTAAFKEIGVQAGKTFRTFSAEELKRINKKYLTLAHYDAWYRQFIPNTRTLTTKADGKRDKFVDAVNPFLANNALKTTEDFVRARKVVMDNIGVRYFEDLDTYKVIDDAAVKEFLSQYAKSTELIQSGLSREEAVKTLVDRMLVDMYNTFHGGARNFNDNLYNAIKAKHDELVGVSKETGEIISRKWQRAAESIDFNKFEETTFGFQPTGEINTAIEFEELITDLPGLIAKKGNTAMEWMDRQVTGIFRQPAVLVTYTQIRKRYAKLEQDFVFQTMENLRRSSKGRSNDEIRQMAEALADRRFTEIATQQAADTILKYADNPNIRTNFAVSIRTVGRFYRATEDFFRRVYRLKDVTPLALYRLRLAHVGLDASGSVYEDQDGEPYILMPMDDVIFKAINGPAMALRGEPLIKNAQFNDFTLKLKMINPSFSPDAGTPALSGPIAGLGVIAAKAILGKTGVPMLKKAGEELDTFALGELGDNIDVYRAVVPASLQRIWNALSPGEKSRQETTAVMQAIAYHQTQNNPLLATATEQEKMDWLRQIRISANNVLFLRNMLGLISPVAPSSQESKGVPDYLLNVGITGLRPEFFDILQAITAKGDVEDPYELALATFVGKYPNKTIYTVSRDEKNTKFVIQKTEQVKSWAIDNKKLLDKYGEAAWIFAPQIGDFNMGVYNWLEASDLIQDKSIEQYLQDVLVAEDKKAYYDIAQREKELLSQTTSISQRRAIIKESTRAREILKTSNPLLNVALTGGGNEIATEERMLNVLSEAIDDPDVKINKETRTKMKIAINSVREFVNFSNDPTLDRAVNPVAIKAQKKEQLLANLEELAAGDPAIREAMRAVFRSLLNYYSRDTYVAIRGGY